MSAELKPHLRLEVGHILFLDIVGYSKLLADEQKELIQELNQVVRETKQFQAAEAEGKLTRLPTGDGMVLVFTNNPEAPVECALEISRTLQSRPQLKLRMGIHSGPVNPVADVNDQANLAGAGINIAQRVMSCGDAGHILLSKHFAEDLEHYAHWRSHLHNVGQVQTKHGAKIQLVNLFTDQLGNAALPAKLRQARTAFRLKSVAIAALLLIAALGVAFWMLRGSQEKLKNPAAPIPSKSIAVLPFENLSSDKENAYFTDGVQDEILTNLARIADLKVISRMSVMQYKSGVGRNLREVAQQLGVANVVEGTVQRSGNRVRVNAQLIDARTDRHLWGQTYDRDLADVFAIQSEIAKTIADQLQAKLSPNEKNAIERAPTRDIAAFDLYTRAKNILAAPNATREELLQAVDLLNQAVARDPSFLDAYCQLAYAHDCLYFAGGYGLDHTPARLGLAEAAIEAATRLNPNAGEIHLARAQNLYWGYLDYNGALAELETARQTLPNDFHVPRLMGYIQRRQGHWVESTRNLEHSAELNPRNIETRVAIAMNYTLLRRYADLKSALASTLAVFPNDLDTMYWSAYVQFQAKADTRPLHQLIDSIRATNPTPTTDIAEWWLACALAERDVTAAKNASDAHGENSIDLGSEVNLSRSFVEGLIARMRKDEGKAQPAFVTARAEQQKVVQAQPNDSEALGHLGLIDAYLGRKEEALREGRRAVEMEKDPLEGVRRVANLAMIAGWVGDKDLAFEQLESIIRRPSPLSYGGLKLFPWWDPLRGDSRFEKIVEESKQPVALK